MSRFLSAVCFVALLSGCSPPIVEQVKAPKVNPLPPGAAARSIRLDRVILDIPKGTVVGEGRQGWACIGSEPLKWTMDERDYRDGDFHVIFDKLARESGFRLPAKPKSAFEPGPPDVDLLVGAKLMNVKQIDCATVSGPFGLGPSDHKGSVRYTVHWEIYDPAQRKLLLAIETQGSGVLDEFRRDGIGEYYLRAFGSASEAFFAHPEFRKLVSTPHG
jgi:hypothetical protein